MDFWKPFTASFLLCRRLWYTLYVHAHGQFYCDCTITARTIDFILGNTAAVFQSSKLIIEKPLITNGSDQSCMVTAQGRAQADEPSEFQSSTPQLELHEACPSMWWMERVSQVMKKAEILFSYGTGIGEDEQNDKELMGGKIIYSEEETMNKAKQNPPKPGHCNSIFFLKRWEMSEGRSVTARKLSFQALDTVNCPAAENCFAVET
nr:pectinesterase-like [Ipomoea batatas]